MVFEFTVKKLWQPQGFTVVELIVVAAIFVILFASSLVAYRQGERLEELRLAGQQLASEIEKAQTAALAGLEINDQPGKSFGLYLATSQPMVYQAFVDLNANQAWDPLTDSLLEEVALPSKISLSGLSLGGSVSSLTIIFVPPKPNLYINGSLATGESVISLVSQEVSNKVMEVKLWPVTGRVYSQMVNNP